MYVELVSRFVLGIENYEEWSAKMRKIRCPEIHGRLRRMFCGWSTNLRNMTENERYSQLCNLCFWDFDRNIGILVIPFWFKHGPKQKQTETPIQLKKQLNFNFTQDTWKTKAKQKSRFQVYEYSKPKILT